MQHNHITSSYMPGFNSITQSPCMLNPFTGHVSATCKWVPNVPEMFIQRLHFFQLLCEQHTFPVSHIFKRSGVPSQIRLTWHSYVSERYYGSGIQITGNISSIFNGLTAHQRDPVLRGSFQEGKELLFHPHRDPSPTELPLFPASCPFLLILQPRPEPHRSPFLPLVFQSSFISSAHPLWRLPGASILPLL